MGMCRNCGNRFKLNDTFCTKCGSSLESIRQSKNLRVSEQQRQNLSAISTARGGLKPSVAGIAAICLFVIGGFVALSAGTQIGICQGASQFSAYPSSCGGENLAQTIGVILLLSGVGLGIYALVRLQKLKPRIESISPTQTTPFAPPGWYPVEGRPDWFTWWDGARWGEPEVAQRK